MNVKGYYKGLEYDWLKARKEGKITDRLYIDRRLKSFTDEIDFKGKKVLDLGCNTGVFSFDIEKMGAEVVAGDISKPAIERAIEYGKSLGSKVEFMVLDAEKLPFKEKKFDVVLATGILEHVENPEKVVEGIYKCLKPGGKVIAEVPHRFSLCNIEPIRRLLSTRTELEAEPFHTVFDKEGLRELFKDFKLIRIKYGGFLQELFGIFKK